jgi:hypothetical protein
VRNEVRVVEGVDRLRRKLEHNEMLRAVHKEVSVLLREAPRVEMSKSKLGGEAAALRGIPAVAKNVRGAIRGSEPEAETVARLTRQGL